MKSEQDDKRNELVDLIEADVERSVRWVYRVPLLIGFVGLIVAVVALFFHSTFAAFIGGGCFVVGLVAQLMIGVSPRNL